MNEWREGKINNNKKDGGMKASCITGKDDEEEKEKRRGEMWFTRGNEEERENGKGKMGMDFMHVLTREKLGERKWKLKGGFGLP